MALKKYFADGNSSWKTILDEFLCNVGGKFILFCNFDTHKLPAYIPAFYKECLDAWLELKNWNVVSYEDVINQIIWNNKNIVVDKQSLFKKHLFCQGMVKIGDLLSNTGKFLQSSKVLTANLSPTQYFKLIGVVEAIPIAWRQNSESSNIKYWTISFTPMIRCSVLKWLNRLCARFVRKKMNPSSIYSFIVL